MDNVFASVEGYEGGESFTDELETDAAPQKAIATAEDDDEFSF